MLREVYCYKRRFKLGGETIVQGIVTVLPNGLLNGPW